ncbi:MAG: FAD-dependent oxidoreductase [Pseudomonadota bacterium]|nr:FAD-dependent oxidoreductase [Pseudomonadota bacterium]
MPISTHAVVVGAGIAGVMTALYLQRRGCSVTLVDRWEPGHSRASSSDYNRILRAIHGSDEMYTRWVREARLRWMELEQELNTELYIECGALILAEEGHSTWEEVTMPTFDKLGVPYVRVEPDELPVRFPQFDFRKVAFGLWEPEAGMVLAHRAVTETFKLFQREGGQFRRGRVTTDKTETPLLDGKPLSADLVVMSCGSWLTYLFRQTLGPLLKVIRQDIVYTSTPDGDRSFDADQMPCFVDHGYGAYGIPSVYGWGVKAAIAWHATDIDLDDEDRVVDQSAIARSRQYWAYRFPRLANEIVIDQKACHISLTPDTHFIIDFHPQHSNVLIVGGCSGHLFKHGPMLGDYVAGVGLQEWGTAPRFKIGPRTSMPMSESPSGR